jgi:hypothetical protein
MIARLMARWEDPRRRAYLLWAFWAISTGLTVFGFGVILYRVFISR